jgi:hypothetical protein
MPKCSASLGVAVTNHLGSLENKRCYFYRYTSLPHVSTLSFVSTIGWQHSATSAGEKSRSDVGGENNSKVSVISNALLSPDYILTCQIGATIQRTPNRMGNSDNAGVSNQYLTESPTLYLVLRQDIICTL